jgi:hypothetical protein
VFMVLPLRGAREDGSTGLGGREQHFYSALYCALQYKCCVAT